MTINRIIKVFLLLFALALEHTTYAGFTFTFDQAPMQVQIGVTYTYSVKPLVNPIACIPYNQNWSIIGGEIVENNGLSVKVKWQQAQTHKISYSWENEMDFPNNNCQPFMVISKLPEVTDPEPQECDPLNVSLININGVTEVCDALYASLCVNIDDPDAAIDWFYNGAIIPALSNKDGIKAYQPGEYKVRGKNQCYSYSNTIVLDAILEQPEIEVLGDQPFCEGQGEVTLSVPHVPGQNYFWYKDGFMIGDNINEVTINSGGSYQLTIEMGGCSISSLPLLINSILNPSAEIYSDDPLGYTCVGGAIGSLLKFIPNEQFQSFTWLKDGQVVSNEVTYLATEQGNYQLKTVNQQGCEAYSNVLSIAQTGLIITSCAQDALSNINSIITTINSIDGPLSNRTNDDKLPCPADIGVGEKKLNIFSFVAPLDKSCNRLISDDCHDPLRNNYWLSFIDDRRSGPYNNEPYQFRFLWGAGANNYSYYGACSPDPDGFDNEDIPKLLIPVNDVNNNGEIENCNQNHSFKIKFFAIMNGEKKYIHKHQINKIYPAFVQHTNINIPDAELEELTELNKSEYVAVSIRLNAPDGQIITAYIENNYNGTPYMQWKEYLPIPANAGTDILTCDEPVFQLNAEFFEDLEEEQNGIWELVDGPGEANIEQISDPKTMVQLTEYGEYMFKWTVNDYCSDEVKVAYDKTPVIEVQKDKEKVEVGYPLIVNIIGHEPGYFYKYQWGDDTEDTSDQSVYEHIYDAEGIYTIKVFATSVYGCMGMNSTEVEVYAPLCESLIPGSGEGSFKVDINTGQIAWIKDECVYNSPVFNCMLTEAEPVMVENVVKSTAVSLNDTWEYDEVTYNKLGSSPEFSNQFERGIKGKQRMESNFSYNTSLIPAEENFKAGTYSMEAFHWKVASANDPTKWLKATTIDQYSPNGDALQETNILGVSSSAKLGYYDAVPYLVAQNTSSENVFFESFENEYTYDQKTVFEDGWALNPLEGVRDANVSHAGRYALKFEGQTLHAKSFKLNQQIKSNGLLMKFWVKVSDIQDLNILGSQLSITLKKDLDILNQTFDAQVVTTIGEWKLCQFVIHDFFGIAMGESFTPIINYKGESTIWIDDLRIQPSDAQMVAHVYDPVSLKLLTTFDDQHFGVYYQYNAEGKLIRKKIETERGSKTVQETHYLTPKQTK